jgi:hypothetical protein
MTLRLWRVLPVRDIPLRSGNLRITDSTLRVSFEFRITKTCDGVLVFTLGPAYTILQSMGIFISQKLFESLKHSPECRVVDAKTARLLAPAVFYDGFIEIDLDKMTTSRALGNHFVLSFAVHLLDQTSCNYVVTNVNRCRSLLMSQRELESISSNDIGAIQHGVFATFCLFRYRQRKLRG